MTTQTPKQPETGIGSDALLNGHSVALLTIEEQNVIEARLMIARAKKGGRWNWAFFDDNSGFQLAEASGVEISKDAAQKAAIKALETEIRRRAELLESKADRIADGEGIEWRESI